MIMFIFNIIVSLAVIYAGFILVCCVVSILFGSISLIFDWLGLY